MAMTVCEYAYRLVKPDATNIAVDVANMRVPKPLIATPEGSSQVICMKTTLNTATGRADLVFSSGSGKSFVEHALCEAYIGNSLEYLAEWKRSAYLIDSRVQWLKDAEKSGEAHKIGRGLAYKLFGALVDYNSRFRGMEEVVLHSENFEATSKIKFQTTEADGTFTCSPYWIDSVNHISGFILNGSDAVDSKECVYISHGWGSFKVAEPLRADKTYQNYVRMQDAGKDVKAGDVFIFDGDRIIASCQGLKFQRIPRKVLNIFLPPTGAAAAKSGPPARQIAAPKAQASKQIKPAKPVKTTQVSISNIATVNKKLLSSVTNKVLEILAAEVGVGMEELVDNIGFSDLGVDSLMSLTVSGRIREEMDIEVHSHDFNDHPTIGQFKTYLSKFEGESVAAPVVSSSSTEYSNSMDSDNEDTPDLADDDSNVTTPLDDSSDDEKISSEERGGLGELIRTTIAEEMGVDTDEIADTVDLSSLGMDSLMSLTILGRLREKTDLTLPGDLFVENTNIRDIKRSLNLDTPAPAPPKIAASVTVTKQVVSKQVDMSISRMPPQRLATSVLLQGSLRTAEKQLWIIPDGGGSATSYVDIPDLTPKVAVMGLNSPYMKTPEEYKCGVIGMATAFITEMKRRQPQGPYMLAGWSAGGVIAFEAVNQLTKNGDEVEKLILIDSPCPDIIEPLPASLHRWFASIGLLGDGDFSKLPKWLLPHFAASVNALSNYTAEKIDPKKSPHVTAIW